MGKLRDGRSLVCYSMSAIPRELIEERALEIARKDGNKNAPTELDLARAEDQLRVEYDSQQDKAKVPNVKASKSGTDRDGLEPKDNPAPPPH